MHRRENYQEDFLRRGERGNVERGGYFGIFRSFSSNNQTNLRVFPAKLAI